MIVGGAVYLRSRKKDESGPPADNCEKLRALGGQQAVDACKAVKAGFGVLGAVADVVVPDSNDDVNVRLNGPRVEAAHVQAMKALAIYFDENGTELYPLKAPFATRYQNGFVPVPGHPDFAKGAPGSKSMVNDDWWARKGFSLGKSISSMLSGDPMRDVLTFRWPGPIANSATRNQVRNAIAFPLSGPGEQWIVRGQPVLCAAGTTINSGRDHRTGAPAVACAPASSPTPPPPIVSGGTRTGTTTTTSSGGVRHDYRSDPPR